MGAAFVPLLAAALLGSQPAAAQGAACNEVGGRQLVASFINAFNRGDVQRLDALFARGTWWRWYSVGNAPGRRIQTAADNRDTLVKYFRARHRQHERLTLRSFRPSGHALGFQNFEYEVLRRADDMKSPKPKLYVGTGAVSCWTGKIAVWSMGEES
jgi:hypothetical protein